MDSWLFGHNEKKYKTEEEKQEFSLAESQTNEESKTEVNNEEATEGFQVHEEIKTVEENKEVSASEVSEVNMVNNISAQINQQN